MAHTGPIMEQQGLGKQMSRPGFDVNVAVVVVHFNSVWKPCKGQGFKFEFFSSIQRDTSNLKSHICKTSFRSRALPMERIFSSHFKFSITLCFFILCLALPLFGACLSCSVKFDHFHSVYLLVLFSKVFCREISAVDRIFFSISRDTELVISSIEI
jgi:hypothetical protein